MLIYAVWLPKGVILMK